MTPRAAIRLSAAAALLTLFTLRPAVAAVDQVTTYATITGAALFGIAFDAGENLYVAGSDATGGHVWKVGPGGSPVTEFATGMTQPHGLVFDASGNLYVADWASPENLIPTKIWKITPGGVKTILVQAIASPYDLVIDNSGNLLVSEWGVKKIQKVTMAGVVSDYTAVIGASGDEAGALFYDDATGELYMGSGPNIRVVGPGGSPVTPLVLGGLASVYGLDRGPLGEFYVGRFSWHNVFSVTAGASVLYAGVGTASCGDGPRLSAGLFEPSMLRVHNGTLFISDAGCHKIRTIDLAGASPVARRSWGRLKAIYR